ncbi:glutathione S-transferase [Duganella rhizosphaerae]|uniref:glutathione S-transferase family protein n=1 Tax=Duganella rhizosphaerae TaxID=2885763 RepID=UPI0030EAC97F
MLTILGKSSSINVRKVLWTCAEIGLDYRLEEYGSGFQPTTTPEFLRMNPNGMVPVIIDDGQSLWESNTICRYLAGKHGRTDLLPAEPMARAQVEKWMDWQATELNNAWRYAFMAMIRQSPAHGDAAALVASVAEWNRLMGMLDAQLVASGPFVCGEVMTLADIVLGLSANRWRAMPMARPSLAAVDAWFARLSERDGFRTHGCNGLP